MITGEFYERAMRDSRDLGGFRGRFWRSERAAIGRGKKCLLRGSEGRNGEEARFRGEKSV
jgi:hypothetical protein